MSFQDDVIKAGGIVKKGGIILYPTDTIWGIGCDATNIKAVQRIYEIKKREDSKSMLILLDDAGKLSRYVREVPEIAWQLIEVSDAPLTIIYPGAKNLASSILGEDGSIGIRITSDPFCRELIKKTGVPLVSSSANISGAPSPAIFDEISCEIREIVDYIVNWRQDDQIRYKPSPIIKFENGGTFRIIRK